MWSKTETGLDRRLLIVTEAMGVGGTESHLLRILPCLASSGWRIAAFCLSNRGEHADELESRGVEVITARQGLAGPKRRRPIFLARSATKLFGFMRQWRPHVVHFYLPGPYVVGSPISMINGVPIKVMSRRSLSNYQQNWPAIGRLERLLHKRMDALVGNSQAVVAQLVGEGAPESRVRLIYNGVEDVEPVYNRAHVRKELGIDENAFVGIVTANLIPYKGHRDIIRGLSQAAPQLPSNWRVLLVGRDDGQGAELKRLAKDVGIAGHVQFLGQRLDVPHLLGAADFGLLTSHEEGFSNVIIECMAARLPMVVTAVGGNPEAVVDGETGIVVPPRSPRAIATATLRLAGDPALRGRMGAASKDRVSREFSLQKCVEAHHTLYDELLAKVERNSQANRVPATPVAATIRVRRSESSKRPLMMAYWGRYGALPQLTLELTQASVNLGRASDTSISIATSNELFHRYKIFGDIIFPVKTYEAAIGALNIAVWLRLRRALIGRLVEDKTRAFVTLMPHIWSPLTTPILRQLGIRYTVVVHDADPHKGDSTALVNSWLLREAKSADRIVTLTEAVAERLRVGYRIPDKKIRVLFHPELTYQLPLEMKSQDGPLRVLFFGRLLPYKGLGLFTSALEHINRMGIPLKIGVFGAGAIGAERARLEVLGAEIVNKWIRPNDIADILARHDVVVVCHTAASQSGVIAAAHGAGLPVIVTPVGGLLEQIIPNVTGLVTANTTPSAVAAAILRFVDDRQLLVTMRQRIITTRKERSIERFMAELSMIALED